MYECLCAYFVHPPNSIHFVVYFVISCLSFSVHTYNNIYVAIVYIYIHSCCLYTDYRHYYYFNSMATGEKKCTELLVTNMCIDYTIDHIFFFSLAFSNNLYIRVRLLLTFIYKCFFSGSSSVDVFMRFAGTHEYKHTHTHRAMAAISYKMILDFVYILL